MASMQCISMYLSLLNQTYTTLIYYNIYNNATMHQCLRCNQFPAKNVVSLKSSNLEPTTLGKKLARNKSRWFVLLLLVNGRQMGSRFWP